MDKPEYISVKEVATLLNVDRRTVFRWMQLGRIRPCVRIGATLRFRRGEILGAADRYEYGGPPPTDPAMG